jgi:hypothetical protein
VPGGPVVPILAAALSIWLLSGLNRAQATAGGVALLLGLALYRVFGRGVRPPDPQSSR